MTVYPLPALRAVALRTQGLHTANGTSTTLTSTSLPGLTATVRLHSPTLASGASVRRCKRAASNGGTPVRHLPRTAGAGDGRAGSASSAGASTTPTRNAIYGTLNQIGCAQIDTISVVQRSHYLVLWSRLGNCDPADLDALSSPEDRRLFEGWQHAACYIPLTEYRYQLPHQRRLRENPAEMTNVWLARPGSAEALQLAREQLHQKGAARPSDFENNVGPRSGWWDWKPAKYALEYLFSIGEVMIAERVKFQKVYDLTERVLPDWVDIHEPTPEERDRFWVERGAKALGVCTARQAGDYTWMKVSRSKPHIESLVKDGNLIPIQGQLANGKTADLLIHRDSLSLLQQAADDSLCAQRITFLSPFDSLFWATRRDEMFWGFHQALEAYASAPKRVYGYFCLPILHKDRLVGRFDPKLERKDGTLRLKALCLEAGIKPDEELVVGVAAAMREFLVFHNASNLAIERSQPEEFGKKILAII